MVDDWDFNELAKEWEKRVEVNGYIATSQPPVSFRLLQVSLALETCFWDHQDHEINVTLYPIGFLEAQ